MKTHIYILVSFLVGVGLLVTKHMPEYAEYADLAQWLTWVMISIHLLMSYLVFKTTVYFAVEEPKYPEIPGDKPRSELLPLLYLGMICYIFGAWSDWSFWIAIFSLGFFAFSHFLMKISL